MGKIMQGTRLNDNITKFNPGEYSKHDDGTWWFKTPNGITAHFSSDIHTVIENPNNTITVSPSILVTSSDPDLTGKYDPRSWHGYLENGIWREC